MAHSPPSTPPTPLPGPATRAWRGAGSGKSSLVCALCIGLCGSPKLLGRADNVRDYVMRGQEQGYVQITLCNGEGRSVSVVRRTITKRNTSVWQIDDKIARMEEVKALVSRLGVQVDNLCQFLPQDKVVEFARMSPEQLLVHTEKALGDSTLHELHNQLREHSEGHVQLQQKVLHKRKALEQKRERLEELQGEVRRNERRQLLIDERNLLQKKLPWLQVEVAVKEYNEQKENYTKGREMFKQMNRSYNEQTAPVVAKEKEQSTLNNDMKTALGVAERAGKAAACEQEAADDALEEAEKSVANARDLQERAETRAQEIQSKQAEIAELEAQLRDKEAAKEAAAEAGVSAADHARIGEIATEIKGVDTQLRTVDAGTRGLRKGIEEQERHLNRLDQQLQRMQGAKARMLKSLVQVQKLDAAHVEEAAQWVEANKGRFRGEVFGPIAAEVKCSNATHADFLEGHCPGFLWRSFVTTQAEDRNLLEAELNGRLKYKINTIQYDGDPGAPISYPSGDARQYSQMGVTHTLDQVFRAPEVIKHVLCDHAAVNKTFVGTQETQNQINADASERREHNWIKSSITTLWTPMHRYTKVSSRYSKVANYRVEDARQGQLLRAGGKGTDDQAAAIMNEQADRREQVASLQSELSKLHEAKQQWNQKHSVLTGERNDIMRRMKVHDEEVKKARSKINVAKKLLENLQRRKPVEEQIQVWEEKSAASRLAALQSTRTAVKELLKSTDAFLLSLPVQFAESERRAQCHAWSERFKSIRSGLDQAKAATDKLKKEAEKNKKAAEALKRQAHAEAPLTDELREKLAGLPGTLEEVADKIEELDVSIKRISADEAAVRESDMLQTEVEQLVADLEVSEAILGDADAKTADLRGRWLPSLKELVQRISVSFGQNFSEISCSGEVRLREPPEPSSYDKYAIEIWVKFRESQDLSLLTASQQSGGERSVATILYLISIQDLTKVPFRVIDEINQGMDPRNERKVFKQLVESSCRPGTPQCFLLTPKLLSELPYHPEVSVLNIFNGPYLQEGVQSWNNQALWHSDSLKAVHAQPVCVPNKKRLEGP